MESSVTITVERPEDIELAVSRAVGRVAPGGKLEVHAPPGRWSEVYATMRSLGLWHFERTGDTPEGSIVVAQRIQPARPGAPAGVGPAPRW